MRVWLPILAFNLRTDVGSTLQGSEKVGVRTVEEVSDNSPSPRPAPMVSNNVSFLLLVPWYSQGVQELCKTSQTIPTLSTPITLHLCNQEALIECLLNARL